MASPVEIIDKKVDSESTKLDQKFNSKYFWSSVGLLIGLLVLALIFAWKIPIFDFSVPSDTERWGQYGDFVGGIIGTAITFISILFLYRAYKEQHLANISSKEVNKAIIDDNSKNRVIAGQQLYSESLRRFDDNFKSLMSLYQQSVLCYKSSSFADGKSSLSNLITQYIVSTPYLSKDVYTKRTQSAVILFDDFITKNRTIVNAHMRLLYQMFSLLDAEYINEEDKIIYAKTLRSQLTDEELILIRYNCMTRRGAKMKYPVFHYNILKHLPYLDLFEFKMYRSGLSNKQVNLLNDELIFYRKEICNLFLTESSTDKIFNPPNYSNRYGLRIVLNKSNTRYSFTLEKTVPRPGRNYNQLNTVFDKINIDDLECLLFDFHIELFRHSSFRIVNRAVKYGHKHNTTSRCTAITITAECNNPIIVSYFQIEKPKALVH